MTSIKGGGFDPDDVLGEVDLSASSFDTQHDDDHSSTRPAAKKGLDLPAERKVILIGVGVILAAGIIYATFGPNPPPRQANATQPAMSSQGAPQAMPSIGQAATVGQPGISSGGTVSTQGVAGQPSGPSAPATLGMPQAPVAPAVPSQELALAVANSQANDQLPRESGTPAQPVAAPPAQAPSSTASASASAAPTDHAPADTATRLAALEKRVGDLADRIEEMKTKVPKVAVAQVARPPSQRRLPTSPEGATKAQSKATPVVANSSGAQLKAVFGGRAWFQTSGGQTLNVTQGDNVPGYGTIQSVDDTAGEVRFVGGGVAR